MGIEITSSRWVSSAPRFAVDSDDGGGRGAKAGEHRSIAQGETSLRLVPSFGEAGGVGGGDGGRGISAGESRPSSWSCSVEFCDLPALPDTKIWGVSAERPKSSCQSWLGSSWHATSCRDGLDASNSRSGNDAPNLKDLKRSRSSSFPERFLASHSILIRSAAETISMPVELVIVTAVFSTGAAIGRRLSSSSS